MIDEFKRMYYEEELPVREVAKRLGVSHESLVYKAKNRWGLTLRSRSEAATLAHKKGRASTRHGKDNPNYKHGKSNRYAKYGVTKDWFEARSRTYGNKCEICRETLAKPCIDHDHATGDARGILCSNCNTALGLLKDDPKVIEAARNYLIKGE